VAEWRWECITDDLLDGLPRDAVRAVRQLGQELAVLMLVYLTDVRGERVVLIQVNWIG
jgi:hypothetical protein